jgi:hypothetical protein
MIPFGDFLQAYFYEVCEAEGVKRRHLRIADRNVVFQFSNDVMADAMTTAMAHLLVNSHAGPAALTVSMWDGEKAPRNHVLRAYLYTVTNWWFSYTGNRGVLIDMHGERLLATYISDTRLMCVVDLDNDRAFYWKSDTAPMPYYETCSPFRSLLHGWMSRNGRYFVHGAAVGYADGGVMLVGKGGSGKSTSALSCLASSLSYAGDDYCIVSGSPSEGFEVHSLYCTAKLVEEKNLEAFPSLAGKITNPERVADEKVALSLNEYKSSKLMRKFPLRALLVPLITGRPTTSIVPCSPQDAMMAIAPTTVGQMSFSGAGDLRFMADIARSVPTYRLLLGTQFDVVPGVIEELLASFRVNLAEEGKPLESFTQ